MYVRVFVLEYLSKINFLIIQKWAFTLKKMPVSRAYLYCEISAEHNILTENFCHNVVGT